MVVLMIVNRSEPVYEADLGSSADDLSYLHQFVLHAALDVLPAHAWAPAQPGSGSSSNNAGGNTYLRVIDRFNSLLVSAYMTPGGTTFLLLHQGTKTDDALRNLFLEVHDLYVKHSLNPFAIYDAPIVSPSFDAHIRHVAKRYLS